MQYEVESIDRPDKAMSFAVGCLGFAIRQLFIFNVLRTVQLLAEEIAQTSQKALNMNLKNDLFSCPRRMTGVCAILATGLGLAYLSITDAPTSYLALNAGALLLGFLIVGVAGIMVRSGRAHPGAITLVLGNILLVTSLYGIEVDGAARWAILGGLSVQTSLIALPVMTLVFAGSPNMLSTLGIVVAAIALAIQPDRAMSGALAAAMAVLTIVRHDRTVLIALAVALGGFIVTLFRADTLPAVPYVDQIFYSSFEVHALAGAAVVAGALLMIAPAILGGTFDRRCRDDCIIFGTVWSAIIIAAALGNYPTPVVGYGGSAIIGYVISMLGLPAKANEFVQARSDPSGHAPAAGPPNNLFVAPSYSI